MSEVAPFSIFHPRIAEEGSLENQCFFENPSRIWVNYNISLTWIKAVLEWFPLLTMISSEGGQWGRDEIYPDVSLT